ncbi:Copper transport protein family [Trifolium repens]|nr:Copper transport protein family [Trifolium repens]
MAKREFQEIGIKNSNDFPLIGTSLASVESLSMPLVQEVVLSADMQCEKCQKRVIDVITKMNVETESVEVNVLEKKVTLTFRLPTVAKEITPINSNHLPKYCCMIMRINVDCNACCRKLRRIILRMKAIETHLIEKQQRRVCVCGRFVPADIAIKIKKKMKRRVEILEIQEFEGEVQNED